MAWQLCCCTTYKNDVNLMNRKRLITSSNWNQTVSKPVNRMGPQTSIASLWYKACYGGLMTSCWVRIWQKIVFTNNDSDTFWKYMLALFWNYYLRQNCQDLTTFCGTLSVQINCLDEFWEQNLSMNIIWCNEILNSIDLFFIRLSCSISSLNKCF